MPDPTLRTRLARLHLVWLYLGVCAVLAGVVVITNADLFDGGFGSMIIGLLALFAAPFIVISRLVTAVTYWAPTWLQVVFVIAVALACTAIADRYLTRWLRRSAPKDAGPPTA